MVEMVTMAGMAFFATSDTVRFPSPSVSAVSVVVEVLLSPLEVRSAEDFVFPVSDDDDEEEEDEASDDESADADAVTAGLIRSAVAFTA